MQSSPVPILRIIARLNIGGPAIQAITLTQRLGPPRYESILVAGETARGEGDMSYLADGSSINLIKLRPLGRSMQPWRDLKAWLGILGILMRARPRLVHTHTAKAGAIGRSAVWVVNVFQWILSRLRGRPFVPIRTVHTFHGHVLEGYFGTWQTTLFLRIERLLARMTDRILAVSPSVREDLMSRRIGRPEQWRLVPLGLPLKHLLAMDMPRPRPAGIHIGLVGRLVPIKNHALLLDGIQRCRDIIDQRDLHFSIIGDGDGRRALEQRVRSMGMNGRIVFTGWVLDVLRIYGPLDIVCLTSLNEGTPVSIIEALAAGRGVMASDVGGVRDILGPLVRDHGLFKQHAHGLVFGSRDVEGFRASLSYLVGRADERLAMGAVGRAYVGEHFSLERLVTGIDKIYQEILT
ncbi:MAG: glycosyltransferase [Candidatus Omnitrophica bacterium]|nr:glycosyltransferase [Candidatus Omnitrophota bacterium]